MTTIALMCLSLLIATVASAVAFLLTGSFWVSVGMGFTVSAGSTLLLFLACVGVELIGSARRSR